MTEDGWSDPGWGEAAREHRAQHEHNEGNSLDDSEIIWLEIARLAKLGVVGYEVERAAAAKRLKMRASVLDRLVDDERKAGIGDKRQGQALTLPEPKPWSHPVDGAELLHDLAAGIRRHVVMPQHSADATALWVVQTYMLDALQISPRLAISRGHRSAAA
jgi:hypothetical protein